MEMRAWVLGLGYLAWIITCLTIYARLGESIDPDGWHWKLYRFTYSKRPRSDCEYTKKLFFIPALLPALMIICTVLQMISAVICVCLDWIINPIIFSKRPLIHDARDYMDGLLGKQMDEKFRYTLEYKPLPFHPLKWIVCALCLYGLSVLFTFMSTIDASSINMSPSLLRTVGVIVLIAIAVCFRSAISRTIKSGWKKLREKTCHRISAPPMK